jgi:hypothetical protein
METFPLPILFYRVVEIFQLPQKLGVIDFGKYPSKPNNKISRNYLGILHLLEIFPYPAPDTISFHGVSGPRRNQNRRSIIFRQIGFFAVINGKISRAISFAGLKQGLNHLSAFKRATRQAIFSF